VQLSGYKNITVGLKRLKQLFNAEYESARGLIEKMLPVLDVSLEQIEKSILELKQQQLLEAEIAYKASFKPHFIIRTANACRPKQIFIAGLLNASQYISDSFPSDLNDKEYIVHALNHLNSNVDNIIKLFHEPVDVVINYAYDKAEVVSLSGQHISYLDKSVLNGTISIRLR
jgi:hypothetical protein